MILNKYNLPTDAVDKEAPISPGILKTRREEMGLSQQQVAEGAELLLKQYQRLEVGERLIENASLKTALAICAVLRLDPFIFLSGAERLNAYFVTIDKSAPSVMNENAVYSVYLQAMSLFNSKMDYDFSPDNVAIACCTLKDIQKVYAAFTKRYGFFFENRTMDAFRYQLAEAFVGKTGADSPDHIDGILIRTDPPAEFDRPEYYMQIIVHELSHIYCCSNEIKTARVAGGGFYDRYCSGPPSSTAESVTDGQINGGYAVWREFVADFMTGKILSHTHRSLIDIKQDLFELSSNVKAGNQLAKGSLSRYLSMVFDSAEFVTENTWDQFMEKLAAFGLPFIPIIELIHEQLQHEKYYEINLDFIKDLGTVYLVESVKNTPMEDLIAFAESFPHRFS